MPSVETGSAVKDGVVEADPEGDCDGVGLSVPVRVGVSEAVGLTLGVPESDDPGLAVWLAVRVAEGVRQ